MWKLNQDEGYDPYNSADSWSRIVVEKPEVSYADLAALAEQQRALQFRGLQSAPVIRQQNSLGSMSGFFGGFLGYPFGR